MAKAFSFSLERVLDIRRHKEDQQAIILGKAKSALQKEQQKLSQFNVQKETMLNDSETMNTDTMNLNALKISGGYLQQLNQNIGKQENQIHLNNKKVSIERNKLNEVVKDKKIVEKLKEHKFEDHRLQVVKDEQRSDDEVAVRMVNHARQKR